MSEDLIWNMVANPMALVEIGTLARRADLTAELAELRRREVAVLVLWSDGDGVLPMASLRRPVRGDRHRWHRAARRPLVAAGQPPRPQRGPGERGPVQAADHETTGMRATTAELRTLLRRTKIPRAS